MDANTNWFKVLDKVNHWYQRKDAKHVVIAVNGYKTAEYFEQCSALV